MESKRIENGCALIIMLSFLYENINKPLSSSFCSEGLLCKIHLELIVHDGLIELGNGVDRYLHFHSTAILHKYTIS